MTIPPLPDFVLIIALVIIPFVAILAILAGMYRSNRYWKDSLRIVKATRRALAGFREEGVEGLLRFDRRLDDLGALVPDLSSPTSQVLALFICDAKGVVLNELNPEKAREPQRLKARLSRELASLVDAIATRDVTAAFTQVGRVYLTATLQGKDLPTQENLDAPIDQQILEVMLDFSRALFQGLDRPLSEELGDFLATELESGWTAVSPLAVVGLYWLRQELFEISSELWFPEEPKRHRALGVWATREELLGLSVADAALAVAQADREALVRALVHHHKRQRYPVTLAAVARGLFAKRAHRLLAVSD